MLGRLTGGARHAAAADHHISRVAPSSFPQKCRRLLNYDERRRAKEKAKAEAFVHRLLVSATDVLYVHWMHTSATGVVGHYIIFAWRRWPESVFSSFHRRRRLRSAGMWPISFFRDCSQWDHYYLKESGRKTDVVYGRE
jgi:hypothetical protein